MDDLNPTEICAAKKNKPWIAGGMISPSASAIPSGYSTLTWTLVDAPQGTSCDADYGTVTAGTEAGKGYVKESNQFHCFDSRSFTVVKVEFPNTKPVLRNRLGIGRTLAIIGGSADSAHPVGYRQFP